MEGILSRKIKTRDAAIKNIKKFFRDTVQNILDDYNTNKQSKLLAAERTLRTKYEKISELSKDILDVIDEDNFELEYEKSTDFDMFYHERHIELAKLIKEKEKEIDGSSNGGGGSNELDSLNPNRFNWSCNSNEYHSRDLAINSEYDTVNELTSNELTSDLLELFDGDSLDNDYDAKNDFDVYSGKTIAANQKPNGTKLESYFTRTDNDSGHFSSDDLNTSSEIETEYIEEMERGRNNYTYCANVELPRELPSTRELPPTRELALNRELPLTREIPLKRELQQTRELPSVTGIKETEPFTSQLERISSDVTVSGLDRISDVRVSTVDITEDEYKAYDTKFDSNYNYGSSAQYSVDALTTNDSYNTIIDRNSDYTFTTDIEYPLNGVIESKPFSSPLLDNGTYHTSSSMLDSNLERPTYETYTNYEPISSNSYTDTLNADEYKIDRYDSSSYERNTPYSQIDYTYVDSPNSTYGLYTQDFEVNPLSTETDYKYSSNYTENKEFDFDFKSMDLNDTISTTPQYHKRKKSSLILPNENVKIFNGDPKKWESFLEDFEIEINKNEDLSNMEKMEYLLNALSGEPERFLTSLSLCKENYVTAYRLLKERYDINEVQKKYRCDR